MKHSATRSGLRIRGDAAQQEVKDAILRFAVWARREHAFPVRVPVYLHTARRLVNRRGKETTASFFAPYSRDVEPYIRLATGDYMELKAELGRDDALAALLHSFCHELMHYQQWLKTGTTTERGVVVRAGNMLDAYADYAGTP